MHLYGFASAKPFFAACFPGGLGCTTAHLRRLPRKGRAGGAKDPCSSIACRAQPCQRCSPVLQALILFSNASLRLCFGKAVFCYSTRPGTFSGPKRLQKVPGFCFFAIFLHRLLPHFYFSHTCGVAVLFSSCTAHSSRIRIYSRYCGRFQAPRSTR